MIFANQPDPAAQQQVAPTRLEISPVYPMNRRGPMQPQAQLGGGGDGKGGGMDLGKLIKMLQGKGAAAQSLMGQGDPDPDLQYLQEAAMSSGGGGDGGGITADDGSGVSAGGDGSGVAAAGGGLDTLGSLGDEALIGSYF